VLDVRVTAGLPRCPRWELLDIEVAERHGWTGEQSKGLERRRHHEQDRELYGYLTAPLGSFGQIGCVRGASGQEIASGQNDHHVA
jgi:hypothetical protein